jgi:uncharacterized protein YjiS (DUF1127 family)
MVATQTSSRDGPHDRLTKPRHSAILGLLLCVEDVLQRIRQRHELAKLNDADLKDLGWSRTDVLQELKKPFWR